MNRKLFAATFLWAISVVLAVHLLQFHGSVPDFEKASGGEKLLDVKPSFSVDATYSRLEQYGEVGRRNYFFRNVSVDVVLPLSLLPFLYLLRTRQLAHLSRSHCARCLVVHSLCLRRLRPCRECIGSCALGELSAPTHDAVGHPTFPHGDQKSCFDAGDLPPTSDSRLCTPPNLAAVRRRP